MNPFVEKISLWLLYALPLALLTVKPIAPVIMVLLIFIGMYAAWITIKESKTNRRFVLFSILTTGYFLVMFFSVALSDEVNSTWTHLTRIAFFLFAPFVALLMDRLQISLKRMVYLIKIETIIVGIIAITGAIIANGAGRYTGMYNANTFSDITVTLILLSTIQAKMENTKNFLFTLVAVSFGMMAIVLSGSRAGFIVIVLMMIFYLIIQKVIPHGKYLRAIVLFLVSMSVFLITMYTTHNIQNRLKLINTEISSWEVGRKNTGSVGIRLEMYRAGLKAFAQSPLIGYGYYSSNKVSSRFATTKAASEQMARYWHLHNEYITTMVNAGTVGLLALLALYLVPLRIFLKELKDEKNFPYASLGIFLIVAYATLDIVHGEFGYEYETLWFVFILAYAFVGFRNTEVGAND